MKPLGSLVAAMLAILAAGPVQAADEALLVQIEQNGAFRIWHGKGETNFSEDELAILQSSATAEGGAPVETSLGVARAFETGAGTLIEIPGAPGDKWLLVGRDQCNGVAVWHSSGTVTLTNEQLTELVISALPRGGKTLTVGDKVAKAYATEMGIAVVIWPRPAARRQATDIDDPASIRRPQ